MASIFFDRHDDTFGTELWVTDGSPGGTRRLTDLNHGAASSNPTWLTAAGGKVFFLASDGTSTDLYATDGTSVVPLTTGSSTFIGAYDFVDVNGTLYFDASEGFAGGIANSLWKSDGTAAGTGPVAGDASGPNYLANALGTLFFIAADATSWQLWTFSNGKEHEVTSVNVAGGGFVLSPPPMFVPTASPTSELVYGGSLIFVASTDGGHTYGLWDSDGTNTHQLKTLVDADGFWTPPELTYFSGLTFYFAADDGTHGEQLWQSDGTIGGTQMVMRFNAGSTENIREMTTFNGSLYIVADDGMHGYEIWKSNGTPPGTHMLTSAAQGITDPHDLTIVGNELDFVSGGSVWMTDGTSVSLLRANTSTGAPFELTNVNGALVFGSGGFTNSSLWQSDGTTFGTIKIADGVAEDVFVGGQSGNAIAFLGASPLPHFGRPADFNHDGDGDILWQNDNGQAAIWLMNGATPLGQSAVGANPGASWHVKDAGDFNADGKADILWQNDNGQAAIWLMNGGTPIVQSPVGANPGPTWHEKAAADFNCDGVADILWQNDNGQAYIWLMSGISVAAEGNAGSNPGPSWHVKDAGDFDGDGKADILWQNDNGQAAIWLMNGGTPSAQSGVGSNPGSTWHEKAAADFNGDGMADILWQNDNGQAAIWLMNGLNSVTEAAVGFNPGPSWHVKDAADFNGDGDADILWQNDNGQAAIWLMNGLNPFVQTAVGPSPGASWHLI